MARLIGQWVLALDGSGPPSSRDLIGGKAASIERLGTLGLPVPPAIVITTQACTACLNANSLPDDLAAELADGVAWLEQATGRRFGEGPSPLLVSVRSGAPVSMPGMMDTVLNLGINETTQRMLADECGDAAFAADTRRRFRQLYAQIVLKAEPGPDAPVPEDVTAQLHAAVGAVFRSWNSARARRYRRHHGIAETLGTAVTIQAMVFGNMDAHSGTGVLFSRNPLTGDRAPYGEYLAKAQGEDVVSGKCSPLPFDAMRKTVAAAHAALLDAARRLEEADRDVQDIEFTVERGKLFLLQTRVAKRAPRAAFKIAVDLAREGRIEPAEALRRVTPEQARLLLAPRLALGAADGAKVLAEGEAACPGVGCGLVVGDADEADRRAEDGEAVVLARPTTSPEDVHGMIVARAVVTEQGGSTSHAAVVGRALGKPCVVGCGVGSLSDLGGRIVTVDGQSGRVFDGRLQVETPREADEPDLAAVIGWCEERAGLRVLEAAPDGVEVVDLDDIAGGEDPAALPGILAGVPKGGGARGGAVGSEAGVRAAIAAGLGFVVATPRLPALLAAAHAAAPSRTESTSS